MEQEPRRYTTEEIEAERKRREHIRRQLAQAMMEKHWEHIHDAIIFTKIELPPDQED